MMDFRKSQGITLIALVITIIVLLILAGVTIAALSGDNGILTRASESKEQTLISSEKEAIQITSLSKNIYDIEENENKYDIGKTLHSKTLENSNIWDVIIMNDSQTVYGDGWKYIEKDTEIEDYGNTQYNWLLNSKTGEIIQLEEGKYIELSYSDDIAVTDGLIFNVDSNNMDIDNIDTWGNGVTLHGFENNTTEISNKGLEFDGTDDYVEFKSTADYSKGFTLSFYGISHKGKFFTKQRENNPAYSCRFGLEKNQFSFNTSKNRANSKWSTSENDSNNGNLAIPLTYTNGEIAYIDLTFDAEKNEFKLYKENELIDSDIVNEEYWHGENGGQQILEDDEIPCYLGRAYIGSASTSGDGYWTFGKITIYSLRLYNRALNEEELKNNYDKTIAAHTLE